MRIPVIEEQDSCGSGGMSGCHVVDGVAHLEKFASSYVVRYVARKWCLWYMEFGRKKMGIGGLGCMIYMYVYIYICVCVRSALTYHDEVIGAVIETPFSSDV